MVWKKSLSCFCPTFLEVGQNRSSRRRVRKFLTGMLIELKCAFRCAAGRLAEHRVVGGKSRRWKCDTRLRIAERCAHPHDHRLQILRQSNLAAAAAIGTSICLSFILIGALIDLEEAAPLHSVHSTNLNLENYILYLAAVSVGRLVYYDL